MFNATLLKKSQVKELITKLESYYKTDLSKLYKYNFYINENNGKVYLTNADLEQLEIKKVNGKGIYFGTFHDNDRFRLSIEGSKYIEPKINFVELKQENLNKYLAAKDLNKDEVKKVDWQEKCPFLIVIFEEENLGCVSVKDNTLLLNYIPKSRKIEEGKLF